MLKKAGWTKDDVDLFEINEAFAMVSMIAMQDLGLDHAKVNVHGGATALGHPIGASGARIIATLISALQTTGGKKGIASPVHRRRRSDRDGGRADLTLRRPGGGRGRWRLKVLERRSGPGLRRGDGHHPKTR